MFRRKIYDEIRRWKEEENGASALLLEGARRVGKSTIVQEFAKNEYRSYILIDFSFVSDEFKEIFLDTRNNLDEFFMYLSATYRTPLYPRQSLIIFDEVQLFPPARQFIKQLVLDGRFDYIETGSLISIKENVSSILIPSEEESLRMCPMDFEEFLWALGEEQLASLIRVCFNEKSPLPEDLHRRSMRLWREYMLIGGMPQAVEAYVHGRDFVVVDRAKKKILKLYRDDIEKYGGAAAKRIKAVFDAIPGQLSKHEKKLVYAEVSPGARSRDFATAFTWLGEAATVNLCTLSTDPSLGLALSANETSIKCYLADTGLLSTMAFPSKRGVIADMYRQVLLGNVGINEGMLVENAVAQQLVAQGHQLFFHSNTSKKREDRMEIDFLLVRSFDDAAMKPRISPVEVKSGKTYSLVSLGKFRKKFGKKVGVEFVVHPKPLTVEGNRISLPLYMAHML